MKKLGLALVIAGALFAPTGVGAAPLDGEIEVSGLGPVRVTATTIDWAELGAIFGPTDGDVIFAFGDGSFATLTGTFGDIEDLNTTDHPVGVEFTEERFIESVLRPDLNFILEFIFQGTGTIAGCTNVAGDVCTPGVSPFTITNTAAGSSVEFSVRGEVTDATGPASPFMGTFSTQFVGLRALDILTMLQTQGFVQSSHSSEFIV